MNRATWKAHERAWAEALGGKRIPITGRNGPDVVSTHLELEIKVRQRMPEWLSEALKQMDSWPDNGKLKAVGFSVLGKGKRGEHLLIVRRQDWCEWYGGDVK